jgi:transcription antitermination factor NusG
MGLISFVPVSAGQDLTVLTLPALEPPEQNLRWFAVYTMPQSEQAVRRLLDIRQIESFLPTYETQKVWKNRQRVKLNRPLFPSYVFVHIHSLQRGSVLCAPGALRILGNGHGPLPIPDREIEFLRSRGQRIEPYPEFALGEKVRIRSGPMQGLEGTLVQKRNSLRFVLTIAMINQNAAIEVQGDELEAVQN